MTGMGHLLELVTRWMIAGEITVEAWLNGVDRIMALKNAEQAQP